MLYTKRGGRRGQGASVGIPKILPHVSVVDKSLLSGVSAAFLAKNEIVPAFKQDNVLTQIMADPLNEAAVRDLERVFHCKIQPAIASPGEIQAAIVQCFQSPSAAPAGPAEAAPVQKDVVIGHATLSRDAGDNIVDVVNYLLSDVVIEGASDIHIASFPWTIPSIVYSTGSSTVMIFLLRALRCRRRTAGLLTGHGARDRRGRGLPDRHRPAAMAC